MAGNKIDRTQFSPDYIRILSGTQNLSADHNIHNTITNQGAGVQLIINLPDAAPGVKYSFYCAETVGMRIVAQAGHTIRIEGDESNAGGYVECTTVGSFLILRAMNNTEWVARVKTGTWLVEGASGFEGVAVRVYRSTNQSIPNNSSTDMSFDNERFDTDNMWDISNPTRLTINTTGIYHIYANVEIQAGGTPTTKKSIFVYRHITSPLSDNIIGGREFQSSASNASIFNFTIPWYLVAGDYIHLKVKQDTGSAKNVINDGLFSPEFGAYRIGDLS